MALWSSELAQIVWAESKALGFGRADGSGDVNVIRRMVAQLAASTNGDGFDKREPLPATNDKVYGDTVTGLLSICEGAQNASAPQNRLILWEAGDRTDRPNPATEPAPPPPWNTMQAGITYQGRFQPGGRLIDIFARGPVEGDTDRPVMVNALTGTGLPDGKSIGAAQPATQAEAKPGLTKMAWAIGIAASLLFLFGCMLAIWSGRADGSPLALLRSLDVQYRVIDKLADTCIDYQKVFPSAKPGICNVLFAPSTTYAKPAQRSRQRRQPQRRHRRLRRQFLSATPAKPLLSSRNALTATPPWRRPTCRNQQTQRLRTLPSRAIWPFAAWPPPESSMASRGSLSPRNC